jgi:sodium/hydrogen exchanger-like protein 6/7
MIVGLILRLTVNDAVLKNTSFNDQVFFNLLLPPIILGAGYELHQVSCAGLNLLHTTNIP